MKNTIIFATLLGAATLMAGTHAKGSNQSALRIANDEPIAEQENVEGKRSSPEVVLQLKYDGGELNRIYLTQFRKETNTWLPSVPARIDLCADLCHSGLGGVSCGHSCSDLIPVGLQSALLSSNATDPVFGQPRTDVCPTLCAYGLGQPLCACGDVNQVPEMDWSAICNAFCADRYNLRGDSPASLPICSMWPGCPSCAAGAPTQLAASRAMSAGWVAWCELQCAQGHGGAACNCYRTPFL